MIGRLRALLFWLAVGWPAAVAQGQGPARRHAIPLGFTIECRQCVLQPRHHEFTAPPVVVAVRDSSPAVQGGLRVGDRITHAAGIDIRLPEGGNLFGHRPRGGTLRLTVERDRRPVEIAIPIPPGR